MSGLYIKSDFSDYYDILNNKNSIITYNRYLSECKQRGTALKYLRTLGIKTLELKQVSQFYKDDGDIIVYKNPKGHNGTGKEIMSVSEALQYHSNCLASKYIPSEDGITVKFLQIGKRRFTLYFKKDEAVTLNMGKLISISESFSEYNRLIGLPIFSIDYISNGIEMIATDFNEVENLQNLSLQNYLSPDTIIEEIRNALTVYNKY